MDDWSTIPNRNADREPAPNPTRPLNPNPPTPPPRGTPPLPDSASRVKRHQPAPIDPATNQALDPAGLARQHHNEPRGKAPKPLYPPRKQTVTSIKRPQNSTDREPPLDITRPFMDDITRPFMDDITRPFMDDKPSAISADGEGRRAERAIRRAVSEDRDADPVGAWAASRAADAGLDDLATDERR
jgi:hypothetical protein